MLPGLGPNR